MTPRSSLICVSIIREIDPRVAAIAPLRSAPLGSALARRHSVHLLRWNTRRRRRRERRHELAFALYDGDDGYRGVTRALSLSVSVSLFLAVLFIYI